jgi:hypothetical protein
VLSLPLLAASVVFLALLAAAAGGSAAVYHDRVQGTEVPPISPTRGTFAGIARGQLAGGWRVQIKHRPLSSAATVAITGGSFSLLAPTGRKLGGSVTGGWVTVLDRGSNCADQRYEVFARFTSGSFVGTLTHHRRSMVHHCLIYAATISGRTTLTG